MPCSFPWWVADVVRIPGGPSGRRVRWENDHRYELILNYVDMGGVPHVEHQAASWEVFRDGIPVENADEAYRVYREVFEMPPIAPFPPRQEIRPPEEYERGSVSPLQGVDLKPLPSNVVPLEAIVLVKAVDEHGDVTWLTRGTPGMHQFEMIGALSAALDRASGVAAEMWNVEDDDDDET